MRKLSYGFGICVFVIFSAAAYASTGFHRLAMYFPFAVALGGAVLSAIYLITLALEERQSRLPENKEGLAEMRRALVYLGWFLGYILLIAIAGLVVASVVFLAAFLYREARMRWWGVLISVAGTLLVLFTISGVMRLYWPRNLLGL